jgi:uncharacterized repeat protein (TIGR01451 family)
MPNITLHNSNLPNGTPATYTAPGSNTPISGTIQNNQFVPNPGSTIPNDTTIGTGTGTLTPTGRTPINVPTTITNSTAKTDLGITKTVDKTQANLQDTLNYTITYRNNGPDTATNFQIQDTLPAGLEFQTATNSINGNTETPITPSKTTSNSTILTFTIDSLPNGQQGQIKIVAKIVNASGNITNTAKIIARDGDPEINNNSASAQTTVNAPATAVADLVRTGGVQILGLISILAFIGFAMFWFRRRKGLGV